MLQRHRSIQQLSFSAFLGLAFLGALGGCHQSSSNSDQTPQPTADSVPVTDPPQPPVTDNIPASDCAKNPPTASQTRFVTTIRPAIERSCTVGGCHAVAKVIDLRSFPFDAKGSYTGDAIVATLGNSLDSIEAQKVIVREIIGAVKTDYMPPTVQSPSLNADELRALESWLADGLPVATPCVNVLR